MAGFEATHHGVPVGGITPLQSVSMLARSIAASYEASRNGNARTRGNMSSPPTVTAGTSYATGTYTTQYRYYTGSNSSLYTLRGIRPYQYSSIYLRNRAVSNSVSKYDGLGTQGRVEFMTDAPVFVLHVLGSTIKYRILVDDQFIDSTGILTSSNGGSNYFTLDFSAVGGRKWRKISVEINQDLSFVGAYMTPVDSIGPAPASKRIIVAGDSFTANTISDTAGTWTVNDAYVNVAADYLGVPDVWASGVGGTGYVNNSSTKLALPNRLWDITENAPDVVAICMGVNDGSYTEAQVRTGVQATLNGIRASLPYVPIVVFGAWSGATGPNSTTTNVEGYISSEVAARSDRFTRFVPVSTAAKPWTFGTGKQGTTNGSGNSDLYTGPDGAHPTIAGHNYLGQRFAKELVDALMLMSA